MALFLNANEKLWCLQIKYEILKVDFLSNVHTSAEASSPIALIEIDLTLGPKVAIRSVNTNLLIKTLLST